MRQHRERFPAARLSSRSAAAAAAARPSSAVRRDWSSRRAASEPERMARLIGTAPGCPTHLLVSPFTQRVGNRYYNGAVLW